MDHNQIETVRQSTGLNATLRTPKCQVLCTPRFHGVVQRSLRHRGVLQLVHIFRTWGSVSETHAQALDRIIFSAFDVQSS